MYKFSNENPKNIKKVKEIKLLTNYIPLKKYHAQSNISEYETEISLQKNFSNKRQKDRSNLHTKSVQMTQINLMNSQNNNRKEKQRNNHSKDILLTGYNINTSSNSNLYEYFNEKVLLTQNRLLLYKNNKIKTLEKELTLLKQELNFYEKRQSTNKDDKNNNIKISNDSYNKKKFIKNIYVNKNDQKYTLVNNNCIYLNTFSNNNDIFIDGEKTDKNLDKHLSNLLTENLSNYTTKNKNEIQYKDNESDSNLINFLYQSKKGGHNNNILKENIINQIPKNKEKKNTKINIKKKKCIQNE